jgi:hypothetical protein
VWSFELTAFSMMFLEGYIGAPPTSTVISAEMDWLAAKRPAEPSTAATAVARMSALILDIGNLLSLDWDASQREDVESYEPGSGEVSRGREQPITNS